MLPSHFVRYSILDKKTLRKLNRRVARVRMLFSTLLVLGSAVAFVGIFWSGSWNTWFAVDAFNLRRSRKRASTMPTQFPMSAIAIQQPGGEVDLGMSGAVTPQATVWMGGENTVGTEAMWGPYGDESGPNQDPAMLKSGGGGSWAGRKYRDAKNYAKGNPWKTLLWILLGLVGIYLVLVMSNRWIPCERPLWPDGTINYGGTPGNGWEFNPCDGWFNGSWDGWCGKPTDDTDYSAPDAPSHTTSDSYKALQDRYSYLDWRDGANTQDSEGAWSRPGTGCLTCIA